MDNNVIMYFVIDLIFLEVSVTNKNTSSRLHNLLEMENETVKFTGI